MAQETHKERVDRELLELLNELRVALPGVQVLFAFLLIVPFSAGYPNMTSFQKNVFFATFVATALSSVLLIAPTSNHRVLFRQKDKERLLIRSNKQAIVGLGFLALAIAGATILITDVIFGTAATAITAVVIAVALTIFWFAVPLYRRATAAQED